MGTTKIEWTDATWNPVTGCTPISPGCAHCYAKRMAKRLAGRCGYPAAPHEFDVTLHYDRLREPLRWKKPRRVFVCSMSDLFHEDVPFEFIELVFAMIWLSRTHTFQILTKRPERMLEYYRWFMEGESLEPLAPNLWLGVTAENQEQADRRIPVLLQIPAAVRFVSIEPMLGPVNLRWWTRDENDEYSNPLLDWVIVGGETGPGARPMHPQWVRDVRDQCQAAGVPFFFKGWGDWFPRSQWEDNPYLILPDDYDVEHDRNTYIFPDGEIVHRVGKHRSGRLLDGHELNEYPERMI